MNDNNDIILKEEYADVEIGFNNSYAQLGAREDLHILLILAYLSDRIDYLNFFTNPPSLEDLLVAYPDYSIPADPEGLPIIHLVLPSLTGNAGKQLGNDGNNLIWTDTAASAEAIEVAIAASPVYADNNSAYAALGANKLYRTPIGSLLVTFVPSSAVPYPFGNIYTKSVFTSEDLANDFAIHGATAAVVGGKIRLTGGAGDLFKSLDLLQYTGLEDWEMTVVVNPIVLDQGIAIGIRPTNGVFLHSAIVQDDNPAPMFVAVGANGQTTLNGPTNIPMVANTPFTMVFSQRGKVLTFSVGSESMTHNITTTINIGDGMHSAGRFVIWSLGGTYDIVSVTVTSEAWAAAKLLIISDSKAYAETSVFENAWSQRLKAHYVEVALNTGPGDKCVDVLNKLPEILSMEPQRVLLQIGSNDKRAGRTFNQWSTDYVNIVGQLSNSGADVYHLLQFNEDTNNSGLDLSDYNAFITATYPANRVVNSGVVPVAADGVHLADGAHEQVFDAVVAKIGNI